MSCNSLRIKRPVPYLEYGRLRYWRKLWIGERNAWIGRHKIVIIELFIMSRLEQDPRSAKNILLCVSDRVRATNKDGIGFLGFDTDWHWILCMYPQRAQSWKISDMCLRELCGQRLWTHLLSNLENLVPSPRCSQQYLCSLDDNLVEWRYRKLSMSEAKTFWSGESEMIYNETICYVRRRRMLVKGDGYIWGIYCDAGKNHTQHTASSLVSARMEDCNNGRFLWWPPLFTSSIIT